MNCQFGEVLGGIINTTAPITESICPEFDCDDTVVVVVAVVVGEVYLVRRKNHLRELVKLHQKVVADEVSLFLSYCPVRSRIVFVQGRYLAERQFIRMTLRSCRGGRSGLHYCRSEEWLAILMLPVFRYFLSSDETLADLCQSQNPK